MNTQTNPTEAPAAAAPPLRHRVSSEQLLQGATAVEIEHEGQLYVLRVTRENKLILTK